ncbi:hypothetical protein P692DRAFT_20880128 [Suillus brevipes Sb2]|nr:hypothetical protein P692DRAFT_20880128 [Suillus brevipes Sb2]
MSPTYLGKQTPETVNTANVTSSVPALPRFNWVSSDGSLRPGYTTSNASSSARSSNTAPHHSHHPSPSISSSAKTNTLIRKSNEFSSRSLASSHIRDYLTAHSRHQLRIFSTLSSVLGDYIAQFYAAEEERRRATLNTIQGSDPSPSLSADRHQEVAARARTVIERSRNSVRPLSEAFSSFSREQGLEDSDEAELSLDRYVGGLVKRTPSIRREDAG